MCRITYKSHLSSSWVIRPWLCWPVAHQAGPCFTMFIHRLRKIAKGLSKILGPPLHFQNDFLVVSGCYRFRLRPDHEKDELPLFKIRDIVGVMDCHGKFCQQHSKLASAGSRNIPPIQRMVPSSWMEMQSLSCLPWNSNTFSRGSLQKVTDSCSGALIAAPCSGPRRRLRTRDCAPSAPMSSDAV